MAEMFTIDFENFFIFLLISLFSLLCYSLFFKKPSSVSDLPPSPPSLPIIGHIHLLTSPLLHKSFQKISSKYGPLLHLHFFNFPILLVSSASVFHEIYKTHDVNISSRVISAIDESLIFGSYSFIAASYGDYWKFMKKLIVTKLLGTQALEQSRSIRDDELDRFYRNLLAKSKNNEKIEIRKEAKKLTNNIFCKMIMGRTYADENEAEIVKGLVNEVNDLTKKIFLAAMLRKPLEKLGISLFKRKVMDVSNRFDELLERILKEHEEREEEEEGGDENKKMNMMEVLLAAYKEENAEFKLTRNHIKSFLVDIFIGGTDTSVHTIEWTMAELINNPLCFNKLREEIYSIVGKSRLLQETDLPSLPYLQAVIKESLRLHPLAPFLIRRFQEKCKVGRFSVPEKTTLVVNAYVMMRDPEFWEDPEEFNPERFLGSSLDKDERREQGLKYIPFGAGRRGCPGTNLAYIFVGMEIGTMVQCFDWRIEGENKVVSMEEVIVGGNMIMASPLKCILVPRIDPLNFSPKISIS